MQVPVVVPLVTTDQPECIVSASLMVVVDVPEYRTTAMTARHAGQLAIKHVSYLLRCAALAAYALPASPLLNSKN